MLAVDSIGVATLIDFTFWFIIVFIQAIITKPTFISHPQLKHFFPAKF
jgi:hypothetical protein